MAIPSYQGFYVPLLEVCKDGRDIKLSTAVNLLTKSMGFSEEEKMLVVPSGRRLIKDRICWAKTYLLKAKLIEGTKWGHFAITERGLEVLSDTSAKIDDNYLRVRFPEFKAYLTGRRENSKKEDGKKEVGKDVTIEAIYDFRNAIHRRLKSKLLTRILRKDQKSFKRLLVKLFVAMGYSESIDNVDRVMDFKDGSVDGVINRDALGFEHVYFQAKRCEVENPVEANRLEEFSIALKKSQASNGIFVTTSYFSLEARKRAENLHQQIILIDGNTLTDLMLRYGMGCRVKEKVTLMCLDEDFFDSL